MDSLLQKERDAFRKRALATPAVEIDRRKPAAPSPAGGRGDRVSHAAKRALDAKYSPGPKGSNNASHYKFGVLARIVRHMKQRHQDSDTQHALPLDVILDETSQLNVSPNVRKWLLEEAMPVNQKLAQADDGWVFNPPLPCRDRKSLLRMLRHNDLKGLGGTLREDIEESVPNHAKAIKTLQKDNSIYLITRGDKKEIVFYRDGNEQMEVAEEFKQMWRNVSVEGMHDDVIEEYLNKQGIKSMQDVSRPFRPAHRSKKAKRRNMPTKLSDNDHLQHILKDYQMP